MSSTTLWASFARMNHKRGVEHTVHISSRIFGYSSHKLTIGFCVCVCVSVFALSEHQRPVFRLCNPLWDARTAQPFLRRANGCACDLFVHVHFFPDSHNVRLRAATTMTGQWSAYSAMIWHVDVQRLFREPVMQTSPFSVYVPVFWFIRSWESQCPSRKIWGPRLMCSHALFGRADCDDGLRMYANDHTGE